MGEEQVVDEVCRDGIELRGAPQMVSGLCSVAALLNEERSLAVRIEELP